MYVLMGLMAIGGMSANTSGTYYSNIVILFFVGLAIFLAFQIFLYRRQTLTIPQKLIVSCVPFILGLLLIFNITWVGSFLITQNNVNKVDKTIDSIRFDKNFRLENVNKELPSGFIVKDAIVVPFELKNKTSLNMISIAHAVGVKGLTFHIENDKKLPECSIGNDLFDEIIDSSGKIYNLDEYGYYDKTFVPAGKYEAVKYIVISQTREPECYIKVMNAIRSKKIITIYASDIFVEGEVPLEIVAEPKLISN